MTCPECGARGRAIKPATLRAQTTPARFAALESTVGWAMCAGAACAVGYFRDAAVIRLSELRALPFHKSADAARLACFCFEHSVAAIRADVEAAGVSRIQARIKAACRAGEDDCVRKNPAGRCCLGDVSQVVKAARPDAPPGCAVACCDSAGSP